MSTIISLVSRVEDSIRREIATFLLLTFALAWGCQITAILLGVDFNRLDSSPPIVWVMLIGTAWAPGLAALATRLIYYRSLRGMGWQGVQPRYLLLGAGLTLLFIALSYMAAWLLSPGSFAPFQVLDEATAMLGRGWAADGVIVLVYLGLNGLMLILPIGFFALGEEIGWSGLLAPQLARMTSFGSTALITGIIWALYHFPLMLFGGYTQGVPLWYGLLINSIVLVASGFMPIWLRLKSGSMWPAVLTHTCWNIFMFYLFEPITRTTPLTLYLVGEKGAATAVVVIVSALLFWRLGRSLGQPGDERN
ncbi:MAG: CPBP family intramembrane metalloprotease [Anaerolineales bacterium]|nr:CPBP family intramembrane metalloprotease [Anaerolineales bacterium]